MEDDQSMQQCMEINLVTNNAMLWSKLEATQPNVKGRVLFCVIVNVFRVLNCAYSCIFA